MLLSFHRISDRRFIDAGRVACPVRGGDIDVDRCAGCRWLLSFEADSKTPSIRCRPERIPFGLLNLPV